MKKRSTYEINGDIYEFNNDKLKKIIWNRNPNRGAYEQFYRMVVNQNVGIAYDTVKGWVKNNTNPALEDVKAIAKILGIPYMELLVPTHYDADAVRTRLQKIRFTEVLDPFSLRYHGFSNVLDMIIGMGHNPITEECIDSDFAERIINIIWPSMPEDFALHELLGYRFIYSDDELRNMSEEELKSALSNGYLDAEGNSFYDRNGEIAIDRHKFGERLIENASWLDDEDRLELQEVIKEAEAWWDYCEMPFALLKVDITVCKQRIAHFTYGPGWTKPSHEDRWRLLLDVLSLLGPRIEKTGLCWMHEMHVDQFESEMFLTIEIL